jgi:hypothetical protein
VVNVSTDRVLWLKRTLSGCGGQDGYCERVVVKTHIVRLLWLFLLHGMQDFSLRNVGS